MSPSAAHTDAALASIATRERHMTWQQNRKCMAEKGFLKVFGHPSQASATGYGISTQFQQAITSLMNVGVIVGYLAIEASANVLGRRRSFVGCAWAFLGVTLLITCTNKGGASSANAELFAIKDAVAAEKEMALSKWSAFRLMFDRTELTRTLLTFAALTFHGAAGFPFLAAYSTYFFEIAGSSNAFTDAVIVTCVSIIGAIGGIFANRFVGRRPLLMATYRVQAAIMLVIGVFWSAIPGTVTAGKVVVAMCVIFQCLFSIGCGPVSIIAGGELPSNQLRAVTFGVGNAIGFLANFVITLTTPYFINPDALNIGPKVGYIWFASNLVTLIFVYCFFPETQGRSLEDIDEMFHAKVPLRKFHKYKCTGIVHQEGVMDEKFETQEEVQQTHVEDVAANPAPA